MFVYSYRVIQKELTNFIKLHFIKEKYFQWSHKYSTDNVLHVFDGHHLQHVQHQDDMRIPPKAAHPDPLSSLTYPHTKKSQGVKSGDLRAQSESKVLDPFPNNPWLKQILILKKHRHPDTLCFETVETTIESSWERAEHTALWQPNWFSQTRKCRTLLQRCRHFESC